jgi:hypothetical protein
MDDPLDQIPPIKGRRVAGEPPQGEAGHFQLCPVCGQAFDRRELRQALRHAQRGHTAEPRS